MIQEAIYTNDQEILKVSVEKCEVLLKSNEVLNFPRIIELEGNQLVLAYGRGKHGGDETRPVAISNDFGRTWVDASSDFPMADNVETSGIMGYLRDGTIAYINARPVNVKWRKADGPNPPTLSSSRFHSWARKYNPVRRHFSLTTTGKYDSSIKSIRPSIQRKIIFVIY